MNPVILVPPSNDLLREIEADIDEADRQELRSATGQPTLDTLMLSREVSHECYVALIDGYAVAIFGCAMGDWDAATYAHPWAIFTNRCRSHPREIMRVAREFVNRWSRWYPYLTNLVDARNTRAIRWLESLGFEMRESTTEYATDESPFIRFEKINV